MAKWKGVVKGSKVEVTSPAGRSGQSFRIEGDHRPFAGCEVEFILVPNPHKVTQGQRSGGIDLARVTKCIAVSKGRGGRR